MKRIRIVAEDGSSIELDEETSSMIFLYSEIVKKTPEQVIDEVLLDFIKLKEKELKDGDKKTD